MFIIFNSPEFITEKENIAVDDDDAQVEVESLSALEDDQLPMPMRRGMRLDSGALLLLMTCDI